MTLTVKTKRKSGQVALPTVLLIGGIIVEIVVAGAAVSFFISSFSLGSKLSLRTVAAAYSGLNDALLRIAMNKEFAAAGATYSLAVGGDSNLITVTRTTDAAQNIYNYIIDVVATAATKQKKFTASVVVDKSTGQLNLNYIKEVTVN